MSFESQIKEVEQFRQILATLLYSVREDKNVKTLEDKDAKAPVRSEMDSIKVVRKLFPKALPILLKSLYFEDILALREANKGSKRAIDDIIQQHLPNSVAAYDNQPLWVKENKALRWTIREKYDFQYLKDLKRFMEHFKVHLNGDQAYQEGSHPFVAHYLSIHLGRDGVDREPGALEPSLYIMLEKFGKYFSTIMVTLKDCVRGITIPNLLLSLAQVNNIINLEILGGIPSGEVCFISLARLPELPKMKSLDLSNLQVTGSSDVSIHGEAILPFLQRYGSQLTILCLTGSQIASNHLDTAFLNRVLSNVRCLKIHYDDDRRSLIKLSLLKMPALKKLQFKGDNKGQWDGSAILVDIMRILENVWRTLEILEIFVEFSVLPSCDDPRVKPEWRQRYPHLRIFRTSVWNRYEPWFYQMMHDSCISLQELQFQVLELQYWGRENDQQKFNEWAFRRLPNLEKVAYKCKMFSDMVYYPGSVFNKKK